MANQCNCTKANGERCGGAAQTGKEICIFHDPAHAEQVRQARRAGGITRTRTAAVLPATTPDAPLLTQADILTVVGQTLNQVRRGELNTRAANTIGYLSSVALRVIDSTPIEERLARIEAKLGLGSSPQTAFEELQRDETNLPTQEAQVESEHPKAN
jgi:hypothetical protein